MQDAWTARKAEEIQGYADHNEWKNFFSAIKAVYGPPTKGIAPLLSADDSTLLTEKTQILQRWAEHFQGVLNRPSAISDAAIERSPQVETSADLDLPPSLQETIRAVQQLSSEKTPWTTSDYPNDSSTETSRRVLDALKSSLKRLQINPTNWEELARDRPTCRRTVKTGAAIYEANRIAAAKAKREARKSQLRPMRNAAAQPLPTTTTDTTRTSPDSSDEDQDYTCPHCDRTFTSRNGLVGHLRIHRTETGEPVPGAPTYTHRTRLHCPHCPRTFTHRMGLFGQMRIHESGIDRSLDAPTPPSPTPNPSPCAPTNHSPADIDATDSTTFNSSPSSSSSSSSSSFTATTTATPASVAHAIATATPDTATLIFPATSDIRETGEPVPGAPTYTHRTRLHCPHCPRTFTHRMGLFGHMRIHESGIDHNSDTPTTPIMPSTIHAPSVCTSTNASSGPDTDTAHASAWSVTCESIAQRLENQCLQHQPTPTKVVSTAHTVLALSGTAWVYSVTCASTTICGRQPPATPHIHTPPTLLHHHHYASTLTHCMHQLPPSTQVGSVHLD
nr:unnamed protein product [Spirometra erinaceieuropaei]